LAAAQYKGSIGLVEIETDMLDPDLLMPDEDFLEQTSRRQEGLCPVEGMEARTKWFRENLDTFQGHWEDSLECLGNCAYMGDIPTDAIVRAAIMKTKGTSPAMLMMAMDPCISILNFALMRDKYDALTRWFMGYDGVRSIDLISETAIMAGLAQEDSLDEDIESRVVEVLEGDFPGEAA
jgi:hypothetical protein